HSPQSEVSCPSDNSNVEALEVSRWLRCDNLRGHRGHSLCTEISFVVAISDFSTDGNFNGQNGAAVSDFSTDNSFSDNNSATVSDFSTHSSFNGRNGAAVSDFSTDGDSNGGNNAAISDSCGSFDNSAHLSEPTAAGANCQIHRTSNNCAWREGDAFLQTGECRTRVDRSFVW